MAPGVGVRDGVRCNTADVGVVHSWADCREDGGEAVEGPCKVGARVSDGDGDKFHPPPVFLEGRNEEIVLLGLLRVFLVTSEVSRESNFNENEGAHIFIEVGGAETQGVRDSSGVYEVRCCAVAFVEESLCLFLG